MQKRKRPKAVQPANAVLPSPSNVQRKESRAYERARSAFIQENYEDALQLFSEILDEDTCNTTILDGRAATLEKLGRYEDALKDGMAMIRSAPTEGKGYLRVGKLLMLLNKQRAALRIYDKALGRVTLKDPRYALIEKTRTSVASAGSRGRCDPLKVLPYEVMVMILSYLSFPRRVHFAAVSRSWRNFAHSVPSMWRSLDFGSFRVSKLTLQRYFSYAKGKNIRDIRLSANSSNMNTVIQLLVDHDCYYIESIRLYDCHIPVNRFLRMLRLVGKHLTNLELHSCDMTLDTIFREILTTCPLLTSLCIKDSDRLQINDWENIPTSPLTHMTDLCLAFDVNAEDIDYILRRSQHLRRLEVGGHWTVNLDVHTLRERCPQLISLRFSSYAIEESEGKLEWPLDVDPGEPPGLRHFIVHNVQRIESEKIQDLLEQNSSTLRILDIKDCGVVRREALESLWTQDASKLRVLHLSPWAHLKVQDLLTILDRCPLLESIDIANIQWVTNDVLRTMSQLAHLTCLNISGCQQVTGTGVRAVVDDCPHLEKLIMINCNNISSDAFDYAREKLGWASVQCTKNR